MCTGFVRPGTKPSCGPSALSGSASENALPSRTHAVPRRRAAHAAPAELGEEGDESLEDGDHRRRRRVRVEVHGQATFGLALLDLRQQRVHQALVGPHARLAEPRITLLGLEVARAQHGLVGQPVLDERAGERACLLERVPVRPRLGEQRDHRRHLLRGVVGEREDRIVDVAEVLIEGRRRRPHLARDVDDLQFEHALLGEELRRRVQQPLAGLRGARTDDPTVRRQHPLVHVPDPSGGNRAI